MSQPAEPTKVDLLELDIDCRLGELWKQLAVYEGRSMKLADVSAFMRAAYGVGYCDALKEAEPGAMYSDHGLRVPQRGGKTA